MEIVAKLREKRTNKNGKGQRQRKREGGKTEETGSSISEYPLSELDATPVVLSIWPPLLCIKRFLPVLVQASQEVPMKSSEISDTCHCIQWKRLMLVYPLVESLPFLLQRPFFYSS